jgi:signal transduction histidine kinase
MIKHMCIRNRFLLFFVALIAADLAFVAVLELRLERRVQAIQDTYNELLSYSRTPDYILSGNMSGTFIAREFIAADGSFQFPRTIPLLRNYRNTVLILFGASLAAGILVIVYSMRSVTRPLLRMAGNMHEGSIAQSKGQKQCFVMARLSESLRKYQKELAEHEEERSRAESVELTKNLAAGVAHEIKNPINTVGLIVDHLQTNLSPDDPEKRYDFYKLTENVKNELKRINRIVEGFLRLTKPHVYAFEPYSINDIVREVYTNFEPELARQGVRTELQLSDQLKPVQADRDKMSQVFSNLIINAVEAMPRGGRLTIRTEQSDDQVAVVVEDNGVGIPEENQKNIFSPYYTTKKQGFGLGLSLIQDIVSKHRGKISFQSGRGAGTRFIIQLPEKPTSESSGAA